MTKAEYNREYYRKNRSRLATQQRARGRKNREHVAAWMKDYRRKNAARIAKTNRAWRRKNRARRKVYMRGYAKKNAARIRILYRTRLKYRYQKADGTRFTQTDRADLARSQKHRCFVCRRKLVLHVDHDHACKPVRALLCRECNWAEGLQAKTVDIIVGRAHGGAPDDARPRDGGRVMANAVLNVEHQGPAGVDLALKLLRRQLERAGVLRTILRRESPLYTYHSPSQKRQAKAARSRARLAKSRRRAARYGFGEEYDSLAYNRSVAAADYRRGRSPT